MRNILLSTFHAAFFIGIAIPLALGNSKTPTVYQNPDAVSSHLLQMPYAIAFDDEGRLYAVDNQVCQVFFWEKTGKFIGAFGKKGQGPGELQYPTSLAVIENQIWVADDANQKLHIFSTLGAYQKSVPLPMPARVVEALDSQTALIGSRKLDPRNKGNEMIFYTIDLRSGTHSVVKSWTNDTIELTDQGEWQWKAYGDDIDAQRLANGTVVFGFSQDPALFQLGKDQKIQTLISLNVPTQKPTESEQQWVLSMSFPGGNGQRLKLDKSMNWKWDFSKPKAPYTHFLVKDQKILVALTPLGSIQGIGGGYSRGSYMVLDRTTGNPTHRGTFAYPEDSAVFFEEGRIVGFLLNEDGDFEIRELSFEGF